MGRIKGWSKVGKGNRIRWDNIPTKNSIIIQTKSDGTGWQVVWYEYEYNFNKVLKEVETRLQALKFVMCWMRINPEG